MHSIDTIRKTIQSYSHTPLENGALTQAAVLIPLLQTENGLDLLLTVRTDDVAHHKGQVAFPGGAREPQDNSPQMTALRETEEELALPPNQVEILGRIDDMWTPTGFIVTPIVGYLPGLPGLDPQPSEVSEYFTVPLSFFMNDSNGYTQTYQRGCLKTDVWFYDYGSYTVWGVTAFIIRNLLSILLEKPAPNDID
mgnify:CR=1 FL=1